VSAKKLNRVHICLYGAIAGSLCSSGYALYTWFKGAPLATIEWLAFIGVTGVAGAILLATISELWNWILRGR
jgi:hypothetical protein